MIVWTQQRKEIVESLTNKGVYYPDFSADKILDVDVSIKRAYRYILNRYNERNLSFHDGLIFGFVTDEPINSKEELKKLLEDCGIEYLILNPDTHILLELNIPDIMDTMPIEVNRFEGLILKYSRELLEAYRKAPVKFDEYLPLTSQEVSPIRQNAEILLFRRSGDSVLQAHIPYIDLNWIKSVNSFK